MDSILLCIEKEKITLCTLHWFQVNEIVIIKGKRLYLVTVPENILSIILWEMARMEKKNKKKQGNDNKTKWGKNPTHITDTYERVTLSS